MALSQMAHERVLTQTLNARHEYAARVQNVKVNKANVALVDASIIKAKK